MGKLKAKTMSEKVGFIDPDKPTKEHDQIQNWVYRNHKEIIETTGIKIPSEYKVKEAVWENKLYSHANRYQSQPSVVGFMDIAAIFHREFSNGEFDKNYNDMIVINFEIKSSIPSWGYLIRQLRFYQEFLYYRHRDIIVVSPDDEYQDVLKEQGFYFYKYKDPRKLF